MSDLGRILDPHSIAVVGVSADPAKHGARVLSHLRRLGYGGRVLGVNPHLPEVDGVEMYPSLGDLPEPPDLVVAAVPDGAVAEVVAAAGGVGGVVVFAAGFAETGADGARRQEKLAETAAMVGTRLIGPNSGGIIRPGVGLAASFLTCLERPAEQIRTGKVALVTQSGGIASYLHNLAAGRGEGLAISVCTGNEADVRLGEAIAAVSDVEHVDVIIAVIETLRDGGAFIEAARQAARRDQRIVACRIGAGTRGQHLMTSHTGALAVPGAILDGVFASVGVIPTETPGEAYEVATLLSLGHAAKGGRAGILTHSGGTAILLADLAERGSLQLPALSPELQRTVAPLLDHGSAANPLDMGGIIGGPDRFAQALGELASSGEFDSLLAVSTAHPPAHTDQRAASLISLGTDVPVIHLWMAGDLGSAGLATMRSGGLPVTEEPRAAIRALAGLSPRPAAPGNDVHPITGPLETWGLPLMDGVVASTVEDATQAATALGFPVVLKVVAPHLAHKTEVGAVKLDLRRPAEIEQAFAESVTTTAQAGWSPAAVRIQRYRPGLEMIVGAVIDDSFGPLVSVGMGGVMAEVLADVVFSPGPVDRQAALGMIERLGARRVLDGFRGAPPADVPALAEIVSILSRGAAGNSLRSVEINPLIWDGQEWLAVDWLVEE